MCTFFHARIRRLLGLIMALLLFPLVFTIVVSVVLVSPLYLSFSYCFRARTYRIPDLVVLVTLQIVVVGVVQTAMLDVVVQANLALLVCGCH